jgi:hypothetical protein
MPFLCKVREGRSAWRRSVRLEISAYRTLRRFAATQQYVGYRGVAELWQAAAQQIHEFRVYSVMLVLPWI